MRERYRALRGQQWSTKLVATLPPATTSLVGWMEQHTRLIKQDRYSRVGLLQVDGHGCFLKLYLAKSTLQKAGFHLHIARGLRAFDAGRALRQAGLAVPETRACLLVPEGVLLMTEALAGEGDLREIGLADPDQINTAKHLRLAADVLSDLHLKGFKHGDCKWSNLLLYEGRFFLVDLERAKRIKIKAQGLARWHLKQLEDMARFTADAERFGVRSDVFAIFVERYCDSFSCDSELLLQSVKPHLEHIRRRHLRRYGVQHATRLL
ncbi:MAG: lipopolysaccharide kinase InaA family protein [Pseudomonadota bacterium]